MPCAAALKHFCFNSLDFPSFGLEPAAKTRDSVSALARLRAERTMVTEPNSFGNTEFLEDVIKSINNTSSATDLGQHHKLDEVVPQDKSPSSESVSRLPRRERTSRRNDMPILILGIFVIGTAILLGTLVGWRLGWQKANLTLRASSRPHRASVPSKAGRPDHSVSAANEVQPSSASEEGCGQAAAAGTPAQSPSGGLTICQEGRVIFPLPPSAPSPTRDLKTPQRSPGLEADPTRR